MALLQRDPWRTTAESVRTLTRALVAGRLLEVPDGNVAVSGTGFLAALLVLAAGAQGAFEAEVRGVLGAAGTGAADTLARLDDRIQALEGAANAVCVWSRVPVHREFRDALRAASFTGLQDRAQLDDWARASTQGLIDTFPATIDAATRLVIADAVSVIASWAEPFDEAATTDGEFTRRDGAPVTTPFMDRWFSTGLHRQGGTVFVELPCEPGTTGRATVMRVGFPEDEGATREATDAAAAHTVLGDLMAGGAEPVRARPHVRVPRFRIRQQHQIDQVMRSLGLRSCFTDDQFFAAASAEPLIVDSAVQDALVEVDEHGVKAAAVTAIVLARGAAPAPMPVYELTLDRPFGFALVDPETDLTLFAGWVADPTAG